MGEDPAGLRPARLASQAAPRPPGRAGGRSPTCGRRPAAQAPSGALRFTVRPLPLPRAASTRLGPRAVALGHRGRQSFRRPASPSTRTVTYMPLATAAPPGRLHCSLQHDPGQVDTGCPTPLVPAPRWCSRGPSARGPAVASPAAGAVRLRPYTASPPGPGPRARSGAGHPCPPTRPRPASLLMGVGAGGLAVEGVAVEGVERSRQHLLARPSSRRRADAVLLELLQGGDEDGHRLAVVEGGDPPVVGVVPARRPASRCCRPSPRWCPRTRTPTEAGPPRPSGSTRALHPGPDITRAHAARQVAADAMWPPHARAECRRDQISYVRPRTRPPPKAARIALLSSV